MASDPQTMLIQTHLPTSEWGNCLRLEMGQFFGSMIAYMRLLKMGQKSQAFLTQMVQFWWGNCVSLKQKMGESWQACQRAKSCGFCRESPGMVDPWWRGIPGEIWVVSEARILGEIEHYIKSPVLKCTQWLIYIFVWVWGPLKIPLYVI